MTTVSSTDAFTVDIADVPSTSNVTTISTTSNATKSKVEKAVWTRLNYKGIHHDNRRLLKHRAKNCECEVCYREIYKLAPAETHEEYIASVKSAIVQKEIKKAKKKAMKDVKVGKQQSIDAFFGHFGKSP